GEDRVVADDVELDVDVLLGRVDGLGHLLQQFPAVGDEVDPVALLHGEGPEVAVQQRSGLHPVRGIEFVVVQVQIPGGLEDALVDLALPVDPPLGELEVAEEQEQHQPGHGQEEDREQPRHRGGRAPVAGHDAEHDHTDADVHDPQDRQHPTGQAVPEEHRFSHPRTSPRTPTPLAYRSAGSPGGTLVRMTVLVFVDPSTPAGRVADATAAQLPVTDQGVVRGDGVFESMLYTGGVVRKLDAHLARLRSSAASCDLPLPAEEAWRAAITTAVAGYEAGRARAAGAGATSGTEAGTTTVTEPGAADGGWQAAAPLASTAERDEAVVKLVRSEEHTS